jgi:hypothetical protein
MAMKPPLFLTLATLSLCVPAIAAAQSKSPTASAAQKKLSPAAARMQQKLDHIDQNAKANPVDTRPTQLKEDEVNAWVAEGMLKLPKGVKKAVFHAESGTIRCDANVDFDEITAGAHSFNPLLMIFSGTHDISVVGAADAQAGTGHVHIQSASLDGVEIPRMALELFVNRYLKPKYPNVGLDSEFKMPDRVDTATVGNHYVVLTQK